MIDTILVLLATIGHFVSATSFDIDVQGNYYILDSQSNTLTKYTKSGDSLRAIGGYGNQPGQFDQPSAVTCQANNIYVSDFNNHRIQRFNSNLDYIGSIITPNTANEAARFGYPTDVVVTKLGDVVIFDSENHRVCVYDQSGSFKRSFGNQYFTSSSVPGKLSLDVHDNIYVLSDGSILSFDIFGNFLGNIHFPTNYRPTEICISDTLLFTIDSTQLHIYSPPYNSPFYIQRLLPTTVSMKATPTTLYVLCPHNLTTYSFHKP